MQLMNEGEIYWLENDKCRLPLSFVKLRKVNPKRIDGIKIPQLNYKQRTFLVQIPIKKISNFKCEQ